MKSTTGMPNMALTSTVPPRVHRKRPKAEAKQKMARERKIGIFVFALVALYVSSLWRTQGFLDNMESGKAVHNILSRDSGKRVSLRRKGMDVNIEYASKLNLPKVGLTLDMTGGDKFLVFRGFLPGQGAGNTMAGLLSAHLLALEFNRTVCVSPKFELFHLAFEAIDDIAIAKCPQVIGDWEKYWEKQKAFSINLCNFGSAPNECKLQDLLASDAPVLAMLGNTYPRWPAIPPNFFFRYYQAKPELLKALPYDPKNPPKTVVHLRAPDDLKGDARGGLDKNSLDFLGQHLPGETFLVTNRVAWFNYFEETYGWKHANWKEVIHSGLDISWGGRDQPAELSIKDEYAEKERIPGDKTQQRMQMWSDWYTVLTAEMVYHTHSDFSISALHWQDLKSKSIQGWSEEKKELVLQEESWRVDGETARLVDRRVGAPGTSELRLCEEENGALV